MSSRYDRVERVLNTNEVYAKHFENRGVEFLTQYRTFIMNYPSAEDIAELQLVGHIWTVGDRYYKLADRFYNDPTLWWVIAFFNKRPTESDIKFGDIVYIQNPLDKIMLIFNEA